ncbi:4'-phosphopantetheinyl transferase family protein [Bacillus wiedmannii]|uniref:4'-phosphopantetheinyl transferase family protein n=1 Tax=Bacillus wiedmannii TaxID=1890302 RepID=UPI000BF67D6F|nr:4'-phosphopantetheinyl transferase superfamily protein [Bacillus wiedmannii]PGD97844.1 4'-phosphopantetheinyl transferase [Bacillus wiedmannii]PHG78294.1 4'-phosphopantetheinyl transferase [Bacillus wiedmannii]
MMEKNDNSDFLSFQLNSEIILERKDKVLRAYLSICNIPKVNLVENINVLHPSEMRYYNSLKFDNKKNNYLLGRYVAKKAISELIAEEDYINIVVNRGIFNQPIVTYEKYPNLQVSITHCKCMGAAIAFPEEHPMGIDVESIHVSKRLVMENQMTGSEIELINLFSYCADKDQMLTVIWTVKEALSKVLKCGLMIPFELLEIEYIEFENGKFISTFTNFTQYKAISFRIRDYIFSVVYPKKTRLTILKLRC